MQHKERWPNLCENVSCGFYCPRGWELMVAKLCDLLEALGGVACEQVKEKFGGLRFYVSINETCPDPDLAYLLVDACERASYKTCRTCGQPSVLRRDGTMWLAALCNACGEGWEVV